MKVHLLYRDDDFDWKWSSQAATARQWTRTGRRYQDRTFVWNSGFRRNFDTLTRDLELDTLFSAMARQDDFVHEVVRKVMLGDVQADLDTLEYRQDILDDCLDHPDVIRQIYDIAVEAMEKKNQHYLGAISKDHPDSVLRWSIESLEALLDSIRRLRGVAESNTQGFSAEGWRVFFTMIREQLDDEYVARVRLHLAQLRFRNGMLLSAELGRNCKASGYVLHRAPARRGAWLGNLLRTCLPWMFEPQAPVFSYCVHPRDENGFRALAGLRNHGIANAAAALGQSAAHVRDFFTMLRTELSFYIGCLNLHEQLRPLRQPLCRPQAVAPTKRHLSFHDLYDVSLALTMGQQVVGNEVCADGRNILVITGANQGGKSTFLRSVGQALLMMQCGMRVPAGDFRASICGGLFTHYRREEDSRLDSGKLDEELARMSAIVENLSAHPVILFNESFAATNEREGSEIARQIVTALLEAGVRVLFVTHLYQFAHDVFDKHDPGALFLRADRDSRGGRPFKLVEGGPLRTSFGLDLYTEVFEPTAPGVRAAPTVTSS